MSCCAHLLKIFVIPVLPLGSAQKVRKTVILFVVEEGGGLDPVEHNRFLLLVSLTRPKFRAKYFVFFRAFEACLNGPSRLIFD